MEEILKAISNVGFPIAVAVFVLIRIEPKLDKLIKVIGDLVPVVENDSENTKGVKEAITDLKIEIGKLNGRK